MIAKCSEYTLSARRRDWPCGVIKDGIIAPACVAQLVGLNPGHQEGASSIPGQGHMARFRV